MKQYNDSKVTVGTLMFPTLTNNLEEAKYAERKATYWFILCKDGWLPTGWREATPEGTPVDVRRMQSEADYIKSVTDYQHYLDEIKAEYGIKIEIELKLPESEA